MDRADDGSESMRPARRWRPRNWRVGTRLVALIAVPTVVAVALGGLRITENVGTTITHDHIEEMGSLGSSVVTLANELGTERLLSAAYIADDPDPEKREEELLTELQDQHDNTQQARQTVMNGVNELGDPHSPLMENRMDQMLEDLEELDTIREDVAETRDTVLPVATKYRQVIDSLTGFTETIADATEDSNLSENVQALTALSYAREQLSYEGALILHALHRGNMSGGVMEAVENGRARYENEVQNYNTHATVEQRQRFDESFAGLEVSQMSTMRLRVMMRAENGDPLSGVSEGDAAAQYRENAAGALEQMYEFESSMADGVRDQAAELRTDALIRSIIDSLVVLLVIVGVFFITSAVARSLVRPLRALSTGAMRVAKQDLPDSIARVQEMSIAPEDVEAPPAQVTARDEIGEVARSFDEVHRVALRLASEEAALRSNVNAMFVNLSRRSQTLVERQIRVIDGLEQTEQDSDRLADLFRLDHLATRMRRNNENLLVLSGQDNTRKWAQPVPLVDVLRGAVSEVEQYDRVNVRAPSHISVLGRPVNDVIHLVAELVENATSFSSHDSPVGVTAEATDDGSVRVEITDSGIGMPADELEAINQRLAEPPVIDVAVSRRMGLFVVSRLAARHGIDVALEAAHNDGIVARVILPSDLLITPVEPAPEALDSGSAVPDTFAEATAAFAANPAPAEPFDSWSASGLNDGGSAAGSGLPKRTPGENKMGEHPPSGQDLWSQGGSPTSPAASRSDAPEPPPAAPEQPASPWSTGGAQEPAAPGSGWVDPPAQPNRESSSSWRPAAEPDPDPAPAQEQTESRESPWRTDLTPEPGAPQEPAWRNDITTGSPPESTWRSEHPTGKIAEGAAPAEQAPPPPANAGPGADRREGYGSTAYLSKRYGTTGARQDTVVPPSPEDSSEALPIFDAIESNWFKRRTGGPASGESDPGTMPHLNGGGRTTQPPSSPDRYHPAAETAEPVVPHRATPADDPAQDTEEWHSEADQGWQAAQTAADPSAGGLTSSGLPKRVPKANLVPGAAPQPDTPQHAPGRSADRARDRFSGFQQGLRQGRDQTGARRPEER